ncbi:MAG TPA: DUF2267 domain-containing protein [Polyangia bacterium]|jgi:uncharacterized protein (DUF2267 family)|nr:DUF2267 domain-containing protein [Polyangia bacterium]
MQVDRDSLIADVMWRGAVGEAPRAEAAVLAVLDALAGLLPPPDAELLAASLPPDLAGALAPAEHEPPSDPGALFDRVAAAEHVSAGLAVEHARAACEALAAAFDPEQRILLARRLPHAWAELFAPPPRAPAAELSLGTPPGHGHTLATGRPGSDRPLAGDRPADAQAHSVAEENPHADTKLSSAPGPVVERPLATARNGSEEPLAEARDERQGR